MPFYRKRVFWPEKGGSQTEPPHRRGNRSWKRIVWKTISVLAVLFAVSVFAFTLFAAWVSRDLPNPDNLLVRDIPQSTKILDRTGKVTLYEIHGDEKRTLSRIEDIPKFMQGATVAIEDKKFYEHHGVYWKGLIRVVFLNVFRGKPIGSGASTLTQQFVKNALLTNERSLLRKVKELILALQIERRYGKDQILQMYLNEIPYGSNLYGVESASQAYFGKPAKDVALDEAALLAAIPQQPDTYNPYGTGSRGDNRPRLIVRQHYILDLMAEQGYATEDEVAEAKTVDTLKKLKPRQIGDIRAPHFVMYVKSLLTDAYGTRRVEQGGLKVVTTLDADMQQAAEDAVIAGVEARGKTYGFGNAALVSLDPKTGQILAMVGSKDFFDKEIDGQVNVTLMPRQPGSSFKPIVYAAGFIRGYLPETKLWDVFTSFKTDTKNYEPHNYDLKERGPVSIRQALQWSLNIPAVQMLYLVGVGRTLDFAETLGYTTFGDRSRFGLSLVLGGGDVLPIEHAAAYATFATEGIRYPTSAILKVEDPSGAALEEWKQPEGTRVFEPQTARLVSSVLTDNDTRAAIFGQRNALTLPDRPVAAKTGTTNEYRDAWTMGYTPNLVTAVWVGNSQGNRNMKRGADGSIVAAPIWQQYMIKATKNLPIERFTVPDPIATKKQALLGTAFETKIEIDTVSGKRATEYTPLNLIEERTYYEPHTILYYIDKEDPTGPIPTNPAGDPQFANWEAGVQAWVTRNRWNTSSAPPAEYDDVHTNANAPSVTIREPAANQSLNTRTFTVRADAFGSQPITSVDVLLNNIPVGSSASAPWDVYVRVPNAFEKGYYELTVRATDAIGNQGQTSITINLTADQDALGGFSVVQPAYNTLWSRSSFPKTVELGFKNPDAYEKVEIAFIGSDGLRRLVASEANLRASTPILLPLAPPIGRYQLVASATLKGSAEQEEVMTVIQIIP